MKYTPPKIYSSPIAVGKKCSNGSGVADKKCQSGFAPGGGSKKCQTGIGPSGQGNGNTNSDNGNGYGYGHGACNTGYGES